MRNVRPRLIAEPMGMLVEQAAIDPDDRDGAEVAAAVDRLSQDVRTVRSHERRDLDAVDDGVEAGAGVRLRADRVDAGVRTAPIGQFLDPVVDVLLLEIERCGARRLRQSETFRDGVDGDHPFGTQHEGALDRELADRAAAPDRDGVAALQVAEVGGHVAGRKNVRQKEHLLVAQSLRHLDRADVGIGHTEVFGLAAGVAAQHVRVAEQARGRVAPELLRHLVIGVGALAAREEAHSCRRSIRRRRS